MTQTTRERWLYFGLDQIPTRIGDGGLVRLKKALEDPSTRMLFNGDVYEEADECRPSAR